MKTTFKLVGLSRPKSFTCTTLDGRHCFWPKHNFTQEKFNELWNYCKDNWSDEKYIEIECDELYDDGTPKNPKVINIKEKFE